MSTSEKTLVNSPAQQTQDASHASHPSPSPSAPPPIHIPLPRHSDPTDTTYTLVAPRELVPAYVPPRRVSNHIPVHDVEKKAIVAGQTKSLTEQPSSSTIATTTTHEKTNLSKGISTTSLPASMRTYLTNFPPNPSNDQITPNDSASNHTPSLTPSALRRRDRRANILLIVLFPLWIVPALICVVLWAGFWCVMGVLRWWDRLGMDEEERKRLDEWERGEMEKMVAEEEAGIGRD